ncbi:MAG: hypothetical protein A2857_02480 [Candidatus Levybacteria bacterium RIFCSPHIGHO2_01_FULL_36_15]|nr:MAG: hypothetical protein A2857_02480 [Candidatus Levybacteria bacterium RIFCSPHIGHO2_01_FULL_36_15]OGH38626.1 MAG: hypothetical protein A2905_05370 [Candidatus Levybacteria bacterium RIFCSPLOWO2_01_FULL_36_10]
MKITAQIKNKKGFTLIELLVVIGILAILLAITLIAINPSRQFSQANNTKRRSDVLQILNAVHQYAADTSGNLPAGITSTTATNIADTGVDICSDIMPTYISALPQDPESNAGAPITSCATYNSGYQIRLDTSNRVIVSAPNADLGTTIEVTR